MSFEQGKAMISRRTLLAGATAGTALSVGPLASTRRACLSEALQTQEQTYLQDLRAVRSFSVAGTQLILITQAGKRLVFVVPTR